MSDPVACWDDYAPEGGTYAIVISFQDETGDDVLPNTGSVTWTLMDKYGNVINSREDVSVTSALEMNIVLSGADLAVNDVPDKKITLDCGDKVGLSRRVFRISGTVNSTIGSNLPVVKEYRFYVANLLDVASA